MRAQRAKILKFYFEILGVECNERKGHWVKDLCKNGGLLTGR